MSFEDSVRIRHLLDAAIHATQFMAGRSLEDVRSDPMLLFALIRCLEVIGEAAGDLSSGCRANAPSIPWSSMIAMRNRLIHGYFDVDPEIVWRTVMDRLPGLIPQLQDLLRSCEETLLQPSD
ncbi:MAG: DUF86 domain-containing protein [Magnetococcales bacterium]|nr:DUF86 domain-containing protein [Magnetococcales bacterium]